jgi:hypothetical protein
MKKKRKQPKLPTECVCESCGIKRHDLGGGRVGDKKRAYCYRCRKTTEHTVIDS